MTKKSKPSPSKTSFISGKQGGVVILVVALLILGVNWLLNQRGEALPTAMTDAAETVVATEMASVAADDNQPEAAGLAEEFEESALQIDNTADETTAATETGETESVTANTDITDLPWADADGDFDYYVLALSWQPAFCETRSQKPECAGQTGDRYDAANFVLHGLWPNRNDDPSHSFAYCEQPNDIVAADRDGDWCDLPDLPLSAEVENELGVFMPGAASCLDHHEWYKHGVCADMSADAYFALSNELVDLFGQSNFNEYVGAHIGGEVSRSDLLDIFEAEFGSGADDFLSLRCTNVGGESLLSEIRLVLKKDLAELEDFSELFPNERVSPDGNCPSRFRIDAAG